MRAIRNLIIGALALTAVISSDAFAQGTTDSDNVTITLDVDRLILMADVDTTFTLGTWSGGAAPTQTDAICIATNIDSGSNLEYKVTATGDSDGAGGAGTDFFITRSAAPLDELAYTVEWNDTLAAGSFNALTATTPRLSNAGEVYDTLEECTGGYTNNARFRVTIKDTGANSLMSVHAGSYSGVLTILVAPETAGGA